MVGRAVWWCTSRKGWLRTVCRCLARQSCALADQTLSFNCDSKKGGKRIRSGDRSIACSSTVTNPQSPHQVVPFTRGTSQQNDRPSLSGFGFFRTTCVADHFLRRPRVSTMDADSQQQWLRVLREQLSTMDENSLQRLCPDLMSEAISSMDRAKEDSSVALASAVFHSVSVLLMTLRV